jgi:hypothetical protein
VTDTDPTLDTWTDRQLISVDALNNLRDLQMSLAYAPLAVVQRIAAQSIPNATNTAVVFDSQVVDTVGMFTPPSASITIKRPGVYSIHWQPHFATSSAGSIRQGQIQVNGATVAAQTTKPSANDVLLSVHAIIPLITGDVITGVEHQDTGGALNSGSSTYGAPRLSVRFMSAAEVDVDYVSNPDVPAPKPPVPPKSKPPTGHKPTRHTTVFPAIWSRSFDGDNGTTWDDSPHCYQGYYSGDRGNTRSIVGFDYKGIMRTLAGATSITCGFSFRPLHTYSYSGSTILVGASRYTGNSGTWYANRRFPLLQKSGCVPGKNYYVTLPKGTGDRFKSGYYLGMAFGPGPTTSRAYYAFMAGARDSGRPTLTFTYWK